MSDLDDELAALEKEVENENKINNQKESGSKANTNNNQNKNFTNENAPKQSHKINYEEYGDDSNILESFLSGDNIDYNNNNYNNYNKGNNNYQFNNYNNNYYGNQNNYNQYGYNYDYNNNNRNMNNNNNNNYMNNNRNANYNQNNQNYRQNINNNPNTNMTKNQNQGYMNQHPQQQQKQSQQPPKQSQIQQQGKQSQVQQKQRQSNINKSKNIENNEPKEDIYPDKQEGMYHKVKEMKSLTVLEDEIALCDKIIAFKKKKGLDYDEWETKKDLAELQLNSTKTLIENGQMDFEAYKKMIIGELQYENKILKFTEMDKKSKPYELEEIKRRIQKRIDTINKELTQNIEEENAEGENQEEQKEQEKTKVSNNIKIEPSNKNQAQKPIIKDIQDLGPQDSEPKSKLETKQANINQHHHHQLQPKSQKAQLAQQRPGDQAHSGKMNVPPQYMIQQKVLVTDPKTGKQVYAMKNVVDPRYLEALKKQQALQQQQQNHHTQVQDKNQEQYHHHQQQPLNQQHIIQQKVLVTDPKTGKQIYAIKNVVDPRDPRYAQAQKQNAIPQKETQQKNIEPQKQSAQNIQKNKGQEKQNIAPPNTEAKPTTNVKQNVKAQPVNNINKEEKEKYQKYINALVKEYTEAKEYFKKCGFEKQLSKCREDLKVLLYAKQKIDYKNYKEVKLSALPKPITPEYIFGYKENERIEKFKAILTQLIKDKNDLDQKMKSILEKLQKLRKKELEKAKETVKPKLDEMKAKKEKIVKLMDVLKEKFKDKWTPAPDYQKVMEKEQVEKVSYEGCKYILDIKVGKTDYDKDKTFLKLKLELNNSKVLQKEVRLKQLGDFNEEWKWEFTADEFKAIPKAFLFVDLYREHTFSTDKKGSGKIDLNSVRRGNPIKTDLKLEIESKRVEPIINFIITPVFPQGKKYFETVSKEAIRLTKIFPAFTGKQQFESENQSQNTNKQAPASSPTTTNKKESAPIQKNNINNTNNAPQNNGKEPVIDKSKFKPEELEDVDIIDNLNSLKVLEFKIKELEAKIKKIDGRTPREMLQKKVKMNCKRKQLEEGMGDGSISPKDYMEFMRIQLEHDQLLALYMKQNNQEEKMKTVLQRVALLKQEMAELKQFHYFFLINYQADLLLH